MIANMDYLKSFCFFNYNIINGYNTWFTIFSIFQFFVFLFNVQGYSIDHSAPLFIQYISNTLKTLKHSQKRKDICWWNHPLNYSPLRKLSDAFNRCNSHCHFLPPSHRCWTCTPGHSSCKRHSCRRWCSCSDLGRGPQSLAWPWPSAARSVLWWTAESWTCCLQSPPSNSPEVSAGIERFKMSLFCK